MRHHSGEAYWLNRASPSVRVTEAGRRRPRSPPRRCHRHEGRAELVRRHHGHASRLGGPGADGDVVGLAAGVFASVDPGEPAVYGRIVTVRAHGPGRVAPVRRMGVESGWSDPRAANPGRPDIELARANETTIRAVAVFVGRAM